MLPVVDGYRRRAKPYKYKAAARFRKHPAAGEAALWSALSQDQAPFRFRRQSVILGWIIDFWCPSRRLAVEVDGGYHQTPEQTAADRQRDTVLSARLNIKTIRFSTEQVLTDLDSVIACICSMAQSRPRFSNWNQGLGHGRKDASDRHQLNRGVFS